MPNPLSKVKPDAKIYMGPDALIVRPHLAALVMQIISHWSYIESFKADLLALMIRTHESIGLAIYQSVKSPTAKRAIIEAAITEGSAEKDRPLFRAVMKATAASERRRHEFAHHLWGYTDALEDALLLVDPKTYLHFSKALTEHEAGRKQITPSWPEYDATAIQVFTESDLLQDVEDAQQADAWMGILFEMCHFWSSETARQQPLSDPRIQQFLQPQSTQNSPSEPSK